MKQYKYLPAAQMIEFVKMMEEECEIKLSNVTYQGILRDDKNYAVFSTISANVNLGNSLLDEVVKVAQIKDEWRAALIKTMKEKEFILEDLKIVPTDRNFNAFTSAADISYRSARKTVEKFFEVLDLLIYNRLKNILDY